MSAAPAPVGGQNERRSAGGSSPTRTVGARNASAVVTSPGGQRQRTARAPPSKALRTTVMSEDPSVPRTCEVKRAAETAVPAPAGQVRGALGLLEPDSSDSDGGAPAAAHSSSRAPRSALRSAPRSAPRSAADSAVVSPKFLFEPPGTDPSETSHAPSRPAGEPSLEDVQARAAAMSSVDRVHGPRRSATEPLAQSMLRNAVPAFVAPHAELLHHEADSGVARSTDSASCAEEPVPGAPEQKTQGKPVAEAPTTLTSSGVLQKRSLASFLGPEEGLAARWSEGPLVMADGFVLPERIAACLRIYQREGVRWLYERLFMENRGCLLTDEMGLGKTVQVACCLVAGLYRDEGLDTEREGRGPLPRPVLVLCPPSLMSNWQQELRRWGPFAVEVLSAGTGEMRQRVLQRVDAGLTDVLVASRGLPRSEEDGAGDVICSRRWGCVVVDEVHQAKNPKGQLHRAVVSLNSVRKLGLTGTPLQNHTSDVWSLLHIVGAHENMEQSTFESQFGRPIAKGQKRKASVKDLTVREDALKEFRDLLFRNCLRRTKNDVALMLPGKNDRIVPCPLSDVQRQAYKNLLESPDWQMALGNRTLCMCGAGRPCLCGAGPIWRHIHMRQAEQKGLEDEWAAADDCGCRGRCPPRCLSFSLIVMLQRLTNHVELLKPDHHPPKDSSEQAQQELMRQVCEIAFKGINHNMCTQRRTANRLQLGSPEACGKMVMLIPLLRHWRRRGQKVLVFSRGTQLLDMLEACLWQQGWSPQVLRLDGTTPQGQRQKLVDEFNTSSTRGIFLISTRAGGVGLNLTAASVVVIFDPDWNPCADLQAQDRSFRIGQTRVVEVYRLLGAGTIEEQVYLRQVWKQQLACTAIDGTRSARRLDDGAFGISSLLELHDGSVLPSLMSGDAARPDRTSQDEETEGGVRVYTDLRGSGPVKSSTSDLWHPDCARNEGDPVVSSTAKDEEDHKHHAPGDPVIPWTDGDEENHRNLVAGGEADDMIEGADSDEAPEDRARGATQAIELLHGMFDQVDHAMLMRNDTQENMLLMDIGEQ